MSKNHRVLLVDDETDFLTAMRRALRREPYELITADSGQAALALLESEDVDLILCDYLMPEMNGLALLTRILSRHPHIMAIMLTALSEMDIILPAINEIGIYKFFIKPVEIDRLKVTILNALEHLDIINEKDGLIGRIKSRDRMLRELEHKLKGGTIARLDPDGHYISLDIAR